MQIVSVHPHVASNGIVEPAQQIRNARLPSPAGTDQCHHLARSHSERDILEHLIAITVAEVDSIKLDLPLHLLQDDGVWLVLDLGHLIEQLKNALARGNRLLKSVVDLRQPPDRLIEGDDVRQEGHQSPQRQTVAHHHPRTHTKH